MTEPHLRVHRDGDIAVLQLARPDAKNAITWAMYDGLVAALDAFDADEQVRVLVLQGSRDAFAAGTDIGQFASFTGGADGLAYERRVDAVLDRLEGVRVLTIAQVEGVAAGAGCLLALACDLRVCTPAARFGVPVARTVGNCLSAANYARMVAWFGIARTRELLYTGRFVTAAEAYGLGLVQQLVQPEAIDLATRELAAELSTRAVSTLRATKEALARLGQADRATVAIDDLIERCYGSADFREGVEAFRQKRPPRFTGR